MWINPLNKLTKRQGRVLHAVYGRQEKAKHIFIYVSIHNLFLDVRFLFYNNAFKVKFDCIYFVPQLLFC